MVIKETSFVLKKNENRDVLEKLCRKIVFVERFHSYFILDLDVSVTLSLYRSILPHAKIPSLKILKNEVEYLPILSLF